MKAHNQWYYTYLYWVFPRHAKGFWYFTLRLSEPSNEWMKVVKSLFESLLADILYSSKCMKSYNAIYTLIQLMIYFQNRYIFTTLLWSGIFQRVSGSKETKSFRFKEMAVRSMMVISPLFFRKTPPFLLVKF